MHSFIHSLLEWPCGPVGSDELHQLETDRGRIVKAMREGYASALMALIPPDHDTAALDWTEALERATARITEDPICTESDVLEGRSIDL